MAQTRTACLAPTPARRIREYGEEAAIESGNARYSRYSRYSRNRGGLGPIRDEFSRVKFARRRPFICHMEQSGITSETAAIIVSACSRASLKVRASREMSSRDAAARARALALRSADNDVNPLTGRGDFSLCERRYGARGSMQSRPLTVASQRENISGECAAFN